MEEQIKKTRRIEYIDLLRGTGIVLMIMGHIGFGGMFDKWIHGFHMPMFFVVSGYFYKERTIKDLLIRRMKSLLLPYIVFGVLCSILPCAVTGQLNAEALRVLLLDNTSGIYFAGALWFLTSMFFTDIIYCLLEKISIHGS